MKGAFREGTLAADYRSPSSLWAHKRTRPVPPKPSPENIQATMTSPLLTSLTSFLSFPSPPLTHLVPEASACPPLHALSRGGGILGGTHLRLRAGAVGTGWPWPCAWLCPGGGAARLRAGSMPAGARPGRTAGLPMYGEPGGPMGAPWWGIRAPDGIPGRWGGGAGGEAETGAGRSDLVPTPRPACLRSRPSPRPWAGNPALSDEWE